MKDLMEQIELCDECEACLEASPTYRASQNIDLSPIGRLRAAKGIFQGGEVTPQMVEAIYTCLECARCTRVCPFEIDVPGIVHQSRIELATRGLGPLEEHYRVMEGIQKLGNTVNGDPSKRVDWLPEEFPTHESNTLFFVGCLASYLAQDAAVSSYLLLKKLGVDFMLLRDEGCCGIYFHWVGKIDLAREHFEENVGRFEQLGIDRLIVACAGCYDCFTRLYPQVLGNTAFEVIHIAQLLPSLLKERGIDLADRGIELTYHDPCGLGRLHGVYREPREALKLCGLKVNELAESRENALCCGGGGAVRVAYRDMCLKIAGTVLDQAPVSPIVTPCAFCQFNLSYAARKAGSDKKVAYITDIIFRALTEGGA